MTQAEFALPMEAPRVEGQPLAFSAAADLEFRAKLDQNEDFGAWKALDEALRQLEAPTMPSAVVDQQKTV